MTKELRRQIEVVRRTAQQSSEMNPIDADWLLHQCKVLEAQAEMVDLGIAE